MTNLPIINDSPQSPAKGASRDAPQPRNGSSAVSGNASPATQANSAANDQIAELFSTLLARQIGEAGFPTPNAAKTPVDADRTARDAQGQATITASNTSDPAGSPAAVLMQIPVQASMGAPAVDARPPSGAPLPDNESSSYPMIKGAREIQQRSFDKSKETDNALPEPDNILQTGTSSLAPLLSGAAKHAEMAVDAAGQHQASQNTTNKTVTPAPASAVMPNIPTSDIPNDAAQTITAPLGHGGWADEFSQKIFWMNSRQNQTAELHLNPPDLGPLNVTLKISDNQLTAQFTSPHSAVRDAVENALPKLREILADNNIMLGNATVSDQPPRDRGGEGFMNQGSNTAAQREISFNAIESDKSLTTGTQGIPARRHNGMLDTFA